MKSLSLNYWIFPQILFIANKNVRVWESYVSGFSQESGYLLSVT